ncbi:hypothetical protein CSKR_201614 [Clonorchis sinensis]|uniref:Uncharacterized protein n=1 Tax=Clonorchis sinensis TaxID=79923 RepID=A0A8T1MS39_CLOSI|nr:hypothetical protein CSKR_201614 [Clonorchis sinensis]
MPNGQDPEASEATAGRNAGPKPPHHSQLGAETASELNSHVAGQIGHVAGPISDPWLLIVYGTITAIHEVKTSTQISSCDASSTTPSAEDETCGVKFLLPPPRAIYSESRHQMHWHIQILAGQ